MSFLSWLAGLVLNFLWGKLAAFFKSKADDQSRLDQNKSDAAQSVQKLKKAQTAQEIDDAADDALNGF